MARRSIRLHTTALIAAFTLGCITPAAKPALSEANPECPHDWTVVIQGLRPQQQVLPSPAGDTLVVPGTTSTSAAGEISAGATGSTTSPGEMLAVPGATTNIPEFHDCQRLLVKDPNGGESYGPLAALFTRDSAPAHGDSALAAGSVVALVFLPQGGSYPPLYLNGYFHCLVIRRAPVGWNAWMVGVNKEDDCIKPIPAALLRTANQLAVREVMPPKNVEPGDIPRVTRWDWDPGSKTQFIGIRCANAWCEVTPNAQTGSSPRYAPPPGMDHAEARSYIVKGWYDEQRLAEFPTGAAVPGVNLGTVVPTKELESIHGSPPAIGEWVPVARTFMLPGPGPYEKSFNFTGSATPPPEGEYAEVSLCRGSWTSCRPDGWFRFFTMSACSVSDDGVRWYASVRPRDGGARYFCVLYRKHPTAHAIPAVTRWRWRPDDETIWVSCPGGCCEVNAKKR
ncbi:MAG: hypothetical protein KJZ74_06100 [Gemmatimonadales bacterium]|nr:hypothetical protein [Gemmatimonadales bacterium]